MKNIFFSFLIAALLWFFMFSPWTANKINFWLAMSIAALILSFLSLYNQRNSLKDMFMFKPKDVFIGILSAIVLYFVFACGKVILSSLFAATESNINSIYATGKQAPSFIIGGLLLFLIGPAEEVFWRGFIQKKLSFKLGKLKGLLVASFLYAIVHLWSFNLTLLLAALVCGLFWGIIFLKTQRLWPVIISHALWDLSIFIIFPL